MTSEQQCIRFWQRQIKLARAVGRFRAGEGDGDGAAASAAGATTTTAANSTTAGTGNASQAAATKKYDDNDVNRIVAEQKRKLVETNKSLEKRLNEMLESQQLSETQRTEITTQLEQVRLETQTKEELHKSELQKLQEKYKKDTETLKGSEDTWKNRFTEQTIGNALLAAAITGKAFNANTLVKLLRPDARTAEVVGEDGKPTGQFAVKVKINVTKDGKTTPLEVTPEEAVKLMSEQEEHANLFIDKANPGLGGGGGNGTSRRVSLSPKTSLDDYKKNRDAILDSVGKGT